jgi:hypothetical protein
MTTTQEKADKLAATLTDITVTAEALAPVASRVTKFVLRCFSCLNPPQTERELVDDTIKIRKTRNVYQVCGTCAHCHKSVAGFLPTPKATKLAAERNLEIEVLPPKPKDAPKRAKKRPASEIETVVGEVATVEPAAKENKQ